MAEMKREQIVAIAQEKMSTDPRDTVAAILKELNESFDVDDEKWSAMNSALLRLGAERAIAMAHMQARARKRASPTPGNHDDRDHHSLAVPRRGILDLSLPNGSQLGAATVADIDDAIIQHKVQASAHIGWVKFYAALKAKMVKAKVYSVGELFNEGELLELTSASGIETAPLYVSSQDASDAGRDGYEA